ncbi:hypothetical protein POVWA2_045400 [Plasmodium ovale wallikeri]|uniref:Secreted protein n=1 Tax=Plasmodium ovale wallikeri TaxID=864142 RepID=A0A1A8ZFF5_PLAOA|nr:hypothetical protein POVWA1_046520 [Plasmodium ovale wallikeri]SBT43222.1 hypothetical protein POVWA2_045400 [Plasmodium ovale wallikeri]
MQRKAFWLAILPLPLFWAVKNGEEKWSLCKNVIPPAKRISFRVRSRRRGVGKYNKGTEKVPTGKNENIAKVSLSKGRHRRGRETRIGDWSIV